MPLLRGKTPLPRIPAPPPPPIGLQPGGTPAPPAHLPKIGDAPHRLASLVDGDVAAQAEGGSLELQMARPRALPSHALDVLAKIGTGGAAGEQVPSVRQSGRMLGPSKSAGRPLPTLSNGSSSSLQAACRKPLKTCPKRTADAACEARQCRRAPGAGPRRYTHAHMKKRYSSSRSSMKSITCCRSWRWSPPSPCMRFGKWVRRQVGPAVCVTADASALGRGCPLSLPQQHLQLV